MSSAPVSGILTFVILTSPDVGLAHLLVSGALLAQMWPGAYEEVQMLIQLLKLAVPSLALALSGGLITTLTPPAGPPSAQISLAYRTAVLSGTARNRAGEPVTTPHLRAAEVWRLQITDLAVGGVSGLRLAG